MPSGAAGKKKDKVVNVEAFQDDLVDTILEPNRRGSQALDECFPDTFTDKYGLNDIAGEDEVFDPAVAAAVVATADATEYTTTL